MLFKYCEQNCNVAATSPHRFPFSLKKVQITETFYRASTTISKELNFSEHTVCKSLLCSTARNFLYTESVEFSKKDGNTFGPPSPPPPLLDILFPFFHVH
jgi:hypothetical protein